MNRRSLFFTLVLGLFITLAPSAFADDWFNTGSSVRTKSLGFISVNVYSIQHDLKGEKPAKNKGAIVDAQVDKRFILTMMREVPQEKIKNALSDALKMNGGNDKAAQFIGVFNDKGPDLAKGAHIYINYTAASKTVSISVDGGGKAAIADEGFAKAVWRIWFGKIDQPSMGDQLMAKLPLT